MQQTKNRISSGARKDGYFSTPNFPKKSKGDHRRKEKPMSPSQQAAERAAHQRAADRTADRAAYRLAEPGARPADDLIGDRPGDVSRDELACRQPAARNVGAEDRPNDGADL